MQSARVWNDHYEALESFVSGLTNMARKEYLMRSLSGVLGTTWA